MYFITLVGSTFRLLPSLYLSMTSLAAALHVNGRVYPVLQFTAAHHQDTHERGYVLSPVRPGPVELTLDVAVNDTFLPGWAYEPFRHYEANIVCRDADGGSVTHTLHLPQAYCVGYDEHFVAGDTGGGSFQCQVTLVAPDGWRVIPGAPGKFVAPPARNHGSPQTALLGAPLLTPTAPAVAQVVEAVVGATVATVLLPVALTLAFILGSSTPANAPGLPHPHLPPVDPNLLRLNTLAARHAAGSLTSDEEAEYVALLAKVKGVHVRSIKDLADSAAPALPMRGGHVPLRNFTYLRNFVYTKRSDGDREISNSKMVAAKLFYWI
jgi:hypothetical protein